MGLPRAERIRICEILTVNEPGFILRHRLREELGVLFWYDSQFWDFRQWVLRFDIATHFQNN
jgi:hypothetical protein